MLTNYMKTITVLLPQLKLFPLNYSITENIQEFFVGDLVIVPFRNKVRIGIIWEMNTNVTKTDKLRSIKSGLTINRISNDVLAFIKHVSDYYLTELGSIAKLVLPVDILGKSLKIIKQEEQGTLSLPNLSIAQEKALIGANTSTKPVVLKGITGSGKTEIYFHMVKNYLENKKQILIMLPEIALSQQLIKRFKQRFGFDPVVWNATVTIAQKKAILKGILDNKVKVVIGARSSLFLPYQNLGLIVVDEEHDASYKQEEGVLYNARDMAVLRGHLCGAKVILSSATPSIETMNNVDLGKYNFVEILERHNNAFIPEMAIIDMKQQTLPKNSWISAVLIEEIRKNLEKQEQTLLFLNRRGYSPVMLCKSCGFRFNCDSCSAWLVVHKINAKLECHHCGYQSILHNQCPECNDENSLVTCGPGIERIAEEVQSIFPNSKIALVSKDQLIKAADMQILIDKMENNEIDILIGTQIITKGYHFPNLTLVGVIDADLGFIGGDLRSGERTYQLLSQVGGRAGRENKRGKVLLQTYYPDNMVLKALINNQEQQFLQYEMNHRKQAVMPPFARMAAIILTAKNEIMVGELAKQMVYIAPTSDNIRILGPTKALMYKLSGDYRYRILVIADKKFPLQKYLDLWLNLIKIPSSCRLKLDIDPQSLFY